MTGEKPIEAPETDEDIEEALTVNQILKSLVEDAIEAAELFDPLGSENAEKALNIFLELLETLHKNIGE